MPATEAMLARLDLSKPLSSDQAVLHIAAGRARFVGAVNGRSQLQMARDWLIEGSDELVPAVDAETKARLTLLREAICKAFGEPDGLELKGWAWVWFAKQRRAASVHPNCDENWEAFLRERSSDGRPAAIRVRSGVPADRGLKAQYVLARLVAQRFDMKLALDLGKWGRVTAQRKIAPRVATWRSTGLEPDVELALEKLLRKRPDLITRSDGPRKYVTVALDRFDLYVVLCRVYPALSGQRYSGATILKCLATLVACRRGRRPNAHPFKALDAVDLQHYAVQALEDGDWARYFGFRRR